MRRSAAVLMSLPTICGILSCSRVPEGVIPPDKMALVMADMRMAEAVVGANPEEYKDVRKKLAMKEAVLGEHDITEEVFDTSLVWYGHNIDKYQDVTEKSIEILEKRMKELNSLETGESALSIAGDSVDLWGGPTVYNFHRFSPSSFLTFELESDANWEKGDIYTLRAHAVTPAANASWSMTMTYEDGTVESTSRTLSTNSAKREEISLHSDSARVPVRLSGWISIERDRHKPVILDSLGLTRRRINPEAYIPHRYEQRRIIPMEVKAREDSINKARRDTTQKEAENDTPEIRRVRDQKVISPKGNN